MPTKKRVVTENQNAPRRGLVPIMGKRVHIALRIANVANAEAARRLTSFGAPVSAQAVDNIVNGHTKRTSAAVRSGLAKITGIPAKVLGGEVPLLTPPLPLRITKKGRVHAVVGYDAQNLSDAGGRGIVGPTEDQGLGPAYELVALTLFREIKRAASQRGGAPVVPEALQALLRRSLSLGFWRTLLNEHSAIGATANASDPFWKDSEDFALAMSKAVQLIVKPWLRGDATPRRYAVLALAHGLESAQTLSEKLYRREVQPHHYKDSAGLRAMWGEQWEERLIENSALAASRIGLTWKRRIETETASGSNAKVSTKGLGPNTIAAIENWTAEFPQLLDYLVSVAQAEKKKRRGTKAERRDTIIAALIRDGDST